MGYGNIAELSEKAQVSIRKTRALLRESYQNLNEGNITKTMVLCMAMDRELLEALDSFNEERDGTNVEGRPCKPSWVENSK